MDHPYILYGGDFEPTMDPSTSLGDLLVMLLRGHEDKILQVDAATGETLPADLLLRRAVSLALWFDKMGIKNGDSISVMSENRLEFCIPPVAGLFQGITFAPLNPDYTPGELEHVMGLSKPKVIFCSPKCVDSILKVIPEHPYVRHVVLFGSVPHSTNKSVILLEDIISAGPKDQQTYDEFEPASINPDETLATILCSSGTTGLPKGVMTTHTNMRMFVEIVRLSLREYIEDLETSGSDMPENITIGLAPFFHSMGFMYMFLNILASNKVVVLSKFSPRLFLEAIAKYKVTTLLVPPPVILFMLNHPMVKSYDLSSLRQIRSGAAAMGRHLEQGISKELALQDVSQSYGMTETTLGVLLTPYKGAKLGSVGKLVPGMWCKVVNEEGKPLGPNQEGELCFKGPLIMKGYIGDQKSTNEAIDSENWLHTGDVGYYDKDGYFFIVDRLKELIKYKGYQVAPAELEALLMRHPAVLDAAVVGIPDENVGELPVAFIVKRPGESVTGSELADFIASKVSPQKRLRGGVHFLDVIPRNPTGKILRRVLRDGLIKQTKSKL